MLGAVPRATVSTATPAASIATAFLSATSTTAKGYCVLTESEGAADSSGGAPARKSCETFGFAHESAMRLGGIASCSNLIEFCRMILSEKPPTFRRHVLTFRVIASEAKQSPFTLRMRIRGEIASSAFGLLAMTRKWRSGSSSRVRLSSRVVPARGARIAASFASATRLRGIDHSNLVCASAGTVATHQF